MPLSLGQAAKHIGFSKPTLSRAIKSGKLSATRLDDGSFSIDPGELERWNDNNGHKNHHETRIATEPETPETPDETGVLQVEIRFLRERVEALQSDRERERQAAAGQLADLRQDRDHWREQAERITRQLSPPAEGSIPAPPVAAQAPKRSWWPFGRSND